MLLPSSDVLFGFWVCFVVFFFLCVFVVVCSVFFSVFVAIFDGFVMICCMIL